MSSKVKEKNRQLIDEVKRVRKMNEQFGRTLAALIRRGGPVILTYAEVAAAKVTDKLNYAWDRRTGQWIVTLVEGDNVSNGLGRGSEETGVQQREGDVDITLPLSLSDETSGEVREGDQHDKGEVG